MGMRGFWWLALVKRNPTPHETAEIGQLEVPMNLIAALLLDGHKFAGWGTNYEGENFLGRRELVPLVNNSALMLHYTATRIDGKHLHREATLLAQSHNSGPCLWPVMEELSFVLPHPKKSSTVLAGGGVKAIFASGPREMTEHFREEITVELKLGGELTYAHSWGMPGGTFEARPSAVMLPVAG